MSEACKNRCDLRTKISTEQDPKPWLQLRHRLKIYRYNRIFFTSQGVKDGVSIRVLERFYSYCARENLLLCKIGQLL